MGLRHPPFMVPPGWQWPPFTGIQERMTHAFALSLWSIVFGIPTLLFCGMVRRTVLFVELLTSQHQNATKNPSE